MVHKMYLRNDNDKDIKKLRSLDLNFACSFTQRAKIRQWTELLVSFPTPIHIQSLYCSKRILDWMSSRQPVNGLERQLLMTIFSSILGMHYNSGAEINSSQQCI